MLKSGLPSRPGWPAWLAILCASLGSGCGSHPIESTETVTVLVASSLVDAARRIGDEFEQRHEIRVAVSAAASNQLARQILAGAPAEIFISADPKWIDELAAESLVARSLPLLENRLVLIASGAPGPAPADPGEIFGRNQDSRIAVASPNVPAGKYARQCLAELGWLARLHETGRLINGSNVRVALSYVERGEAEYGIVYATDALRSSKVVCQYELPAELHDRIIYPVALMNRGGQSEAAVRFFEFLQSAPAGAVFREFGFEPLPSRPILVGD